MRPWKRLVAVALFSASALTVSAQNQNPNRELIGEPGGPKLGVDVPKPKVNRAAIEKLGWKLGTQAYTFRQMSLLDTIDLAGDLGLMYIEMFPTQKFDKDAKTGALHDILTDDQISQLKQKLAQRNLVAQSYGVVSVGGNDEATRKVMDFCRKVGIKTVVSEPPRKAPNDRANAKAEELAKQLEADRATFATLDRLLAEYDLNLAIHNHPEPNPYGTPEKVLEVIDGRSMRIGACADLGHWQRSGIKPVDAVKKLGNRIIEFHVKDLNEFGNRNAHDIPWGTGVGDIKTVLVEVKRLGIKPAFSIENERWYPGQLSDIARSIEWFSSTATELAEMK